MKTMDEAGELTERQFATAIPASVRRRLMQGRIESGNDVVALRRFVGLTLTPRHRARSGPPVPAASATLHQDASRRVPTG